MLIVKTPNVLATNVLVGIVKLAAEPAIRKILLTSVASILPPLFVISTRILSSLSCMSKVPAFKVILLVVISVPIKLVAPLINKDFKTKVPPPYIEFPPFCRSIWFVLEVKVPDTTKSLSTIIFCSNVKFPVTFKVLKL